MRDRPRRDFDRHKRFYRIWSTDWFYRRSEVAQKLRAALESVRSALTYDGEAAGRRQTTALAQLPRRSFIPDTKRARQSGSVR
jgi:hypothetical protein